LIVAGDNRLVAIKGGIPTCRRALMTRERFAERLELIKREQNYE